MAVRLICDGCGTSAEHPDDFTERGYVMTARRHYCTTCDTIAADFLRLRDELHTRLARMWESEVETLMAQFYGTHPGFVLPDLVRPKGEVIEEKDAPRE